MFAEIRSPTAPDVVIRVDGVDLVVRSGTTLLAALLAAGVGPEALTGDAPAPWCAMGQCRGCLVTVDDRPSVRACLEPVAAGMSVRLGRAGARPAAEVGA